jgi:hypothetical protein
MISLSLLVKPALDQLKKQLDAAKKQMQFAERQALNDIGKAVQDGLKDEMKGVFRKPTKTTLNSIKFWPARPIKVNGETISSEAIIFIQDSYGNKNKEKLSSPALTPKDYLAPQILGGQRGHKRYELRMIKAGILGSGQYLVPGESQSALTGNVLFKNIMGILSDIKAINSEWETGRYYKRHKGQSRAQKERGSTFFVGSPGGGTKTLAIWERDNMSNNIVPIFIPKNIAPTYNVRFDMYGVAERIVEARLEKVFTERINHAIQTAK